MTASRRDFYREFNIGVPGLRACRFDTERYRLSLTILPSLPHWQTRSHNVALGIRYEHARHCGPGATWPRFGYAGATVVARSGAQPRRSLVDERTAIGG